MSFVQKITNYRRWEYKKLRLLLAWTGGVLLLVFSNITDASLRYAIIFLFLGEGIRIYSLGYIEKKGKLLADSGPYALTRNPLYVGNFFLGFGAVIAFGNPVMLVLFIAGFYFLYRGTIRKEEADLEAVFGEKYRDYKASVPRIIPQLTPYARQSGTRYNWRNILKNREYVTILGLGMLLCGLYLIKEIWGDHEFDWKVQLVIGCALILASALVVERFNRD